MTDILWHEEPVMFEYEDCRLIGIVAHPEKPAESGVVILVGGPQYRAGSHRQFTLLARQLAGQGIASIRFDYRGMGDSEGDMRNFETVDADIRTAIDALMRRVPQIRRIVLWGLCDAASAALYYAHTDARVSGLVLLNPWVHSPSGAARARLKYYYLSRLMQRSFWVKLLSGQMQLGKSAQDLANATRLAAPDTTTAAPADPRHGSPGYIERMLEGLKQFNGNILFLLSGNDLVAREFIELVRQDKRWKKILSLPKVSIEQISEANHTFSSRVWRDQVGQWTARWINKES